MMRTILLFSMLAVLHAPEITTRALVAQRSEQAAHNRSVAGSSPAERIIPEVSPWWWIEAVVTGYSPHDAVDSGHASTFDTKTSTMRDWRTHPYGIAADPRILPYGTYIHVPGYLEKSEPNAAWQVDDTGGRMRQSWRRGVVHIDVRFRTEHSAARFGKRKIEILVDTSSMTDVQRQRLLPFRRGTL